MKGLYRRLFFALSVAAVLTVPTAFRFAPDDFNLTWRWAAGMLWLLPPLVFSLWQRPYMPGTGGEDHWRESLPEIILVLFVLGYLFTGAAAHPWFFFVDWAPAARLNPLGSGPASLFFLWAFFWTILLLRRGNGGRLVLYLLLASQALALFVLLAKTGGLPLYRDDHPSFLFRLWAFGKIFPRLTSYTPFWNGGVMESVITKTGVLAPGILLWPLWKFADVAAVYTPAIGFVYIVFVPWLVVFSLRFMELSAAAALAGGLLSGAVSLTFFLWFLHFGTVGANLTTAFVLPFAACLYRIVILDDRRVTTGLLLALSAFFLLLWPPGGIMLVLVLAGTVFHLHRLSRRTLLTLLGAGTVTGLLYLRSAIIVLRGTDLLNFVLNTGEGAAAKGPGAVAVFSAGLETLQAEVLRSNPLLVVLAAGGLFTLKDRRLRLWFAPLIVAFALVAGWGEEVFPNLQLGRMVLPLLFLALAPAAAVLQRLLTLPSPRALPLKAVLLALLFVTGINGARIYGNGGPAPYTVLPPLVQDLVETVRREVPEGGRVLFAGTTVHAYGRGHVAFLPALAGREMMACDYYAFPPRMVEQNYPPRKYRLSEDDTFRFMDLYNVTLVFTYHPEWREFFLAQPDRYEPVSVSYGRHEHSSFRVLRTAAPLLKGKGTVEADFNVIRVKPAPGQERLVLRYNWEEGLVADGPAVIKPQRVWKDLQFIVVRPNGAEEVVIRHKSWL